MKLDKDARYSKDYEWMREEGDLFVYDISDYAQDQLSDIVFMSMCPHGDTTPMLRTSGYAARFISGLDFKGLSPGPLNLKIIKKDST
jgi:hypothetical protein